MKPQLVEAIVAVRLVELRYQGYHRVVEPYAYGSDKNGCEILRCYQLRGGSESGENVGWKLFKLQGVTFISVSNECFDPRVDYRRDDKAMARIFRQI